MADYLTQELMGEATAPSTLDPRITQTIAILAPQESDTLLQQEVAKRAQELHNRRLEAQADEALMSLDPDPEMLQRLAERYGQQPTAKETIEAAMDALASAETEERRRAMFEQLRQFREERQKTFEEAKTSIAERIAAIEAEREFEAQMLGATGNASGIPFAAVGKTVLDFIDGFMLPGYHVEVINTLKDADPRIAAKLSDYTYTNQDAINALPELINQMEPEAAKQVVDRLLHSARERAGRLFDNSMAEKSLLMEMLEAMENSAQGEKAILNNFLAPLDLVFGAVDVAGAAKVLKGAWRSFKASQAFAKGTPVNDLTPFKAAADNVARAATGNANFITRDDIQGFLSGINEAEATFIGRSDIERFAAGVRQAENFIGREDIERFLAGPQYIDRSDIDRFLAGPQYLERSDIERFAAGASRVEGRAYIDRADINRFLNGMSEAESQYIGRADVERFLAHIGTDKGQAVGTLYLPKVPDEPPTAAVGGGGAAARAAGAVSEPGPRVGLPHGLPFFDEYYLTAAERQAKADKVKQGLEETFSLRLNDLVLSQGEGGVEATVRIGNGEGVGFGSAQQAEEWAQVNLDVPYNVVRDQTGTWQVEFQHLFAYGVDDIGEFIDPVKSRIGIGKGARFADELARGSTQAELVTAKAQELNQQIAEAFTRLTGKSSERVQQVLLNGEREFREYSRDELISMGLNSREIEAYEAVRQLTSRVWKIKNENTYHALKAEGYTSQVSVDGGLAFVKQIDPSSLRPGELLGQSTRTVDLSTGARVNLTDLDLSQYRVCRFFESTASGYTYGVAPLKASVDLSPIPLQVLKKIPGWMPRYYNAPYFIREVFDDGHTVAHMTARSPTSAKQAVARLREKYPHKKWAVYDASEVAAETQTLSDIAMLREAGLLVTSHRKPFALMDADGGYAVINVFDSVQRMISSSAMAEGIGRWTTAMKTRFDNTYGKLLNWRMDLARAPSRAAFDKSMHGTYDEAMAIYNHVRLVNGLHASGPIGEWARGMMGRVADFFYDFGHLPVLGKIPGVETVGRWLGDEISGLNPRAVRAMKSATFTAYIGLNPVVHGILQTSMIPTYAGVRHALPYMAKGKFFTDSIILQFANNPRALQSIMKGMGISSKYVDDLLRDYRNSGLQQMVDNHLSVLGTFGDQRVASSGRVRRMFDKVFQASKSIGFDLGVSIDKRAAWLIMRNRALQDGKKLDATTLKEIAQDAEALTGNLNRSDPLYPTNGVMSLLLQFQSHALKMANRIIGGVTGGRWGGETGLSGKEQFRILVAAALSWGMGGYGISELVERLNTKNRWNLPEDVKLVLNEGLNGYAINSLFRLADAEGEVTKLSAAQRFSPFAQSGMLLTNAVEISKLALEMKWDQLEQFLPAAASLGFSGRMLDALNFGLAVAGLSELPEDERALAITSNFFRKFPAVNNALKAHMSYNLGYKFDSVGRPIVEATKGEALASILGLQSYSEEAVARAYAELYGVYEPLSGEALAEELEKAARDTLDWMIPLLKHLGDGQVDYEQAYELITSHNVAMRSGLEEHEWRHYRDILAAEIRKSELMKGDRLADTLSRGILQGDIRMQSLRDRLYGLDFPQKDVIIPAIERLFDNKDVE